MTSIYERINYYILWQHGGQKYTMFEDSNYSRLIQCNDDAKDNKQLVIWTKKIGVLIIVM